MPRKIASLCCCLGLLIGLAGRAPAATLVRDGKPVAIVALPPEPSETESLAASELILHVTKMSGVKLDTVTVDAPGVDAFLAESRRNGRTPVMLGRNVASRLELLLAKTGAVRGSLAIRATDDCLMIAGVEEGTAYGVFELLEQQGVRWLMPGDLGTVVPVNAG